MRILKAEISQDGNVSLSTGAGLDVIYGDLFESAAIELEQGKSTIVSGIQLIVFGCFWLEAKCNASLKQLLENSSLPGTAGTALWEQVVERASFPKKFAIASAFAKNRDDQRIKVLTNRIDRVIELRNRLAHFKDKDIPIAEAINVNDMEKYFQDPPEPELLTQLKSPKLEAHRKVIADGIAWLDEVVNEHFPSSTLE